MIKYCRSPMCLITISLMVTSMQLMANCMETDRYYWESERRLNSYDTLMQFMACQSGATVSEGTNLNDTSACNWFLSRSLEKLYGVKDFIPTGKEEWLNANAIYDYLKNHTEVWSKLGDATDSQILKEAASGAANGQPVIAVKKGNPFGHVALILPGPLTHSGLWGTNVPNSASFFLSENRVVNKAYIACKLSYAFSSPEGVELFWRLKTK